MNSDILKKYSAFIGKNALFDLICSRYSSRKRKQSKVEEPTKCVPFTYTQSPDFIDGELREYQIEGINWLINMHALSINCILADEMGLGKTLQAITFLKHVTMESSNMLYKPGSAKRPHLLIVPKSTLINWVQEFTKFCPSTAVYKFHCSNIDLAYHKKALLTKKYDVLLTTYEMIIKAKYLSQIRFDYLVIDEAHRIKNESSKLSLFVRRIECRHRLLITGTPLQNNLRELWALLNFLVPVLFNDPELF